MFKNWADFDTPDIGNITLDLQKVKENVPNFTSEKLCEMVACDRYLGCFHEIAIICMEELGKRRANGDNFQFEDRIEEIQKPLPVLNFNTTDIKEILQRAINNRGKS
jgi:hypothetical protein